MASAHAALPPLGPGSSEPDTAPWSLEGSSFISSSEDARSSLLTAFAVSTVMMITHASENEKQKNKRMGQKGDKKSVTTVTSNDKETPTTTFVIHYSVRNTWNVLFCLYFHVKSEQMA
jgi:hypothetical protein